MSTIEQAEPLSEVFLNRSSGGVADELRQTFRTGVTKSLEWRRGQLKALRRLLEENEDRIIEAAQADMGKPHPEARLTEVATPLGDIADALDNLEDWTSPRAVANTLLVQPATSEVHLDPLGVVLIIAPWNYPFALALQPLIGAVAAGNCVVVKPSEITPTSSALMAKLLPDYVDTDCIRVVEGAVLETTALLAQRWDHIFYTGNGQVGRIVMRAAAENLTPVTLELGGKSPCLVAADAELEVTAKRVAWGKWFNAGQTCVAPDYVLVERAVEQQFLDLLSAQVKAFYGADPRRSDDYGRIVSDKHFKRVERLMHDGTPVVGGEVEAAERYIAPTVLTDIDVSAPVMTEEIFGPVLPVLAVDSMDDAIEFVNDRPKPLALYVFTSSSELADRVALQTSSGGMTVNHTWVHLANPNLPFGGVGESGMGAYHGQTSFDTFSHHKSVMKKPTWIDPPVLYPPHTKWKQTVVRLVS